MIAVKDREWAGLVHANQQDSRIYQIVRERIA